MNQDLANLSTDLRRISYWLYEGRMALAQKFLNEAPKKYSQINPKIGCYDNVWQELKKIESLKKNRLKAAEKSLTASTILLHAAKQ